MTYFIGLCAAAHDDVDVAISPESVNRTMGYTQILRCNYTVPPTAQQMKVEWYKYMDDQPPALLWVTESNFDGTNNSSEPGPGYNRTRVIGSPADLPKWLVRSGLVFPMLQLEDEGQYYCKLTYKDANDEIHSGQSSFSSMVVKGKMCARGRSLTVVIYIRELTGNVQKSQIVMFDVILADDNRAMIDMIPYPAPSGLS